MAKSTTSCKTSFSRLPPFWDKSVIFISNIFSLFFGNQKQIEELHKEVGALETYGARMVPILNLLFKRNGNLLVLDRPPDKRLVEYFRWLGLSLPDVLTAPGMKITDLLGKLKGHRAPSIYGYVIDEELSHIAKTLGKTTIGSQQGCRFGNNKRLLHEFLVRHKLTVFDSIPIDNPSQAAAAFRNLKKMGYTKAVVKSAIGASGIGMRKINLESDERASLPPYLFYDGPALAQGWLDESVKGVSPMASPSVLLFVDDRSCWLYDITEQILNDRSVHEGNIAPAPFLKQTPSAKDPMLDHARIAGSWLKDQGYRGTASIDFLVVKRHGKIEVRICEINARVTGATYPAILARRLAPESIWLMRNIRFKRPISSDEILMTLDKKKNLLFSGSDQGVMPFNFNCDKDGQVFKGQFIFIAKAEKRVRRLLGEVKKAFSIPGDVDRD